MSTSPSKRKNTTAKRLNDVQLARWHYQLALMRGEVEPPPCCDTPRLLRAALNRIR